ncbi:hypothetical protein [Spirosoma luteum]|uniref:hypothetical protein n=1 Tax=Spirosoma luteum TaxID=431553 RepID=UPI000376BA89|nr:hypothetical protein [Spirosoma luteum]
MEDEDKEAIIRAKQAISPAGLGDRSDKATTLPGNDSPEDTPLSGIDPTPSEDDQDDDTTTTHPNRNANGKPDIDKPPYS